VDQAAMRRHSVSHRDLDEALHQSSIEDVSKTQRVVLEQSGRINALKS